jgi:hypothetical protein
MLFLVSGAKNHQTLELSYSIPILKIPVFFSGLIALLYWDHYGSSQE